MADRKNFVEGERNLLPYHTGTRTEVRGTQHPHILAQIHEHTHADNTHIQTHSNKHRCDIPG